jgi:hypothetical protein
MIPRYLNASKEGFHSTKVLEVWEISPVGLYELGSVRPIPRNMKRFEVAFVSEYKTLVFLIRSNENGEML